MHLRVMPQRLKVAAGVHRVLDRLAVEHLAVGEPDLQVEPLLQQLAQNLELHLAHHVHAQLPQRLVPLHRERRFLVLQRAERCQHLAQVIRRVPHGARKQHRRQLPRPRRRLRAHAVPGAHSGQPRCAAQLARLRLLDRKQPPAAAAEELRHLLLHERAVRRAAAHLVAAAQPPRRHLQPHNAALAAPHLVGQSRERLALARFPVRLRQQLHPVEEFPHALAAQRGAGKAGKDFALLHKAAQLNKPLLLRDLPLQVAREQLVVERGGLLGQLVAHLARKAVEQHGSRAAAAVQLVHGALQVGPRPVKLVEEEEHRHAVIAQQPPQRFRVALHALRAAHHEHGVVERRQHALRLRGEIGVARRVQQVIHRVPPREVRLPGKHRDAALALHRLRVQKGVAVVHAAALAHCAAQIKQLLRERRLSRVHVGHHADAHPPLRLFLFPLSQRTSLPETILILSQYSITSPVRRAGPMQLFIF